MANLKIMRDKFKSSERKAAFELIINKYKGHTFIEQGSNFEGQDKLEKYLVDPSNTIDTSEKSLVNPIIEILQLQSPAKRVGGGGGGATTTAGSPFPKSNSRGGGSGNGGGSGGVKPGSRKTEPPAFPPRNNSTTDGGGGNEGTTAAAAFPPPPSPPPPPPPSSHKQRTVTVAVAVSVAMAVAVAMAVSMAVAMAISVAVAETKVLLLLPPPAPPPLPLLLLLLPQANASGDGNGDGNGGGGVTPASLSEEEQKKDIDHVGGGVTPASLSKEVEEVEEESGDLNSSPEDYTTTSKVPDYNSINLSNSQNISRQEINTIKTGLITQLTKITGIETSDAKEIIGDGLLFLLNHGRVKDKEKTIDDVLKVSLFKRLRPDVNDNASYGNLKDAADNFFLRETRTLIFQALLISLKIYKQPLKLVWLLT